MQKRPAYKPLQKTSSSIERRVSLAAETAPRKPTDYLFPILATLCVLAAAQWVTTHQFVLDDEKPVPFNYQQASTEQVAPSGLLTALSRSLEAQFPEQSGDVVSDDLFIRASDAVEKQNDELFAKTMMLLGVNALRESDIESAGVYLDEALSVYEFMDDELGIANVELLRGERSIKKRADARRAAYAYDAMQLARWKVSHGQFHDAIAELEYVVNENLALDRYGAAAAAYQTLYKGYTDHGQAYQAQLAGIEIVRLHASSGRSLKANAMIETLQRDGLDFATVQQLRQDNLNLQIDYEESVGQMGQARDYQQLYNHFIAAGDPVRAWQFRVKAQHSLRGATKRAMHRGQTGVLALLYSSNDDMTSAGQSLSRASQLFSSNDQQALAENSTHLQDEIY